ncbi:CoA-disulfide reductase [Massilibacterium senegalense]|uniref:CoA-disulfide reductase n=1 Tax=Massilibacterium senegalense TaxID=1632858 RepID=UPI00078474C1|nr:CoA-disulfide reductase [Massilibacterium senegalense]
MKVVIIGGDAAGMSAAMQVSRKKPEDKVVVLEKTDLYSYAQCGVPYYIGDEIKEGNQLVARPRDVFIQKFGIDARIFHEVTGVDVERKLVTGMNVETNEPFEESYDRLLIASGASAISLPLEGADLGRIFHAKTLHDADRIRDVLQDKPIQTVGIIGGGYIGLEVAENIKKLGKDVHLFQRSGQLAGIFDPDFAEMIATEAIDQGVHVHFHASVSGFKGTDVVEAVIANDKEYPVDLVIMSTGIKPNTHFLKGTEIELFGNGAVKVNAFMETNVKDVYAAGDCATQFNRIKQRDDYIPLGTNANKQGRIAGLSLIDQPKPFRGIVGTSILQFFSLHLGKTGLSETDAKKLLIPYEVVTLKTNDVAHYYPTHEAIHIKLLYHRDTHQLLGGQLIGKKGVDKRTDVLATALYHEMTIEELLDLDLSYAPPFNSVWDPLQQAARRAK